MKLRLKMGFRKSFTGGFAAISETLHNNPCCLSEVSVELSKEQAEELAHWLNKMLFGVRVLTTENT